MSILTDIIDDAEKLHSEVIKEFLFGTYEYGYYDGRFTKIIERLREFNNRMESIFSTDLTL